MSREPETRGRTPAKRRSPGGRGRPWLAVGLVLTGVWAVAATYPLVFRDAVLARLLAGQAAMRDAYEARLADLQTRLDASLSDRSTTQDALHARLADVAERQAELERRHAALGALPGADFRGPAEPPAEPAVTGSIAATPEPLVLRRGDGVPGRRSARETGLRLSDLAARLDGLDAVQTAVAARVAAQAEGESRRLRRAIVQTGLDPARLEPPAPAGLGGPLVPLVEPGFAGALAAARRAIDARERLRTAAAGLPLRAPVQAEGAVTSGFGSRLDPFTRGLALHTGLDLRAEAGEPARATAPGRVVAAEAAGGYGNMVEIDHGHGITTRFAHLARFGVRPGQWVRAGDVVGRVGSTGRSTGAHLHYETRVDGEPVDPQRFLDAGRLLAAAAP